MSYNPNQTAPIPEITYRYMGIEGILATLKNRKIRYSAASLFDDPSECTFKHVRATKEMLRRKICNEDFLHNIGPAAAAWVTAHKGEARRRLKQKCKNRKHSIKNLKTELRNRFHIGCFTVTAFSKKMWFNFANDYSGACLEFNFHRKGCFHKINYSDTLPPYSPAMCHDNGIHFMNILTHKRKKFSWENEYRYIVGRDIQLYEERANGTDTHSDLTYEKDELIAVYIGCNISTEDEQALKSILRDNFFSRIKVYKMKSIDTSEEGFLDISSFDEISIQ